MEREANVEDRVLGPAHEVFDAIVDPARMSRYFITGASGPMKAGTTVQWEFADVGAKVAVDVLEVEEGRRVVYESTATGPRTRVTMTLKPVDTGATDVAIHEAGWPMDREGVKRALGQTAGWTYFLCCPKAYVQHGINLRLGLARRLTDPSA
ncbi:MAG: SRPBCC domain-containing protein [Planctomycetota bacterium]